MAETTASETVVYEVRDRIALLTLNRPESANTLNSDLVKTFKAAVTKAELDSDVRAVIITGAGRHFCGGADLRDTSISRKGSAAPQAGIATDWMLKPVIAAINGAAMGGGLEMALSCDFRLMSSTAKVGLTEIRFGALPAGGGTARAPRLVGLAAAKRLIMIGEPVTAPEALAMGLVDEVFEPEALLDGAFALAQILASRAPHAMRTAKQLLNKTLDMDLNTALEMERTLISRMATPEEMQMARDEAAAQSGTYANIFSKGQK